ncbi:DNA-directed DNA polymerase [Saliniradius amylolyticus]|uniref:Error-prone DNA polymerase n=1 Tax=Saliniradius amylolyticus TaxID=2183582 RepID=A0A2S2DYS0_9ALTE|nr:error-prone DNA polymerase [Saliniradius amylolyticus]AWL10548.1 DNA-directed DNA polymerase [Saliniradius amylolyticus]
MSYAELVCQSNFSFLTGASHPEELIGQADKLGYSALAITDECSVAGVVRAYRALQEHQYRVKLIVGSLFRCEQQNMVLLCPNKSAYSELCQLITQTRRRADKGHYQLERKDLSAMKHLLAIWLPDTECDKLHTWAAFLKKHFAERCWLGAKRHLNAQEEQQVQQLQHLSRQWQLPIVCHSHALMHQPERLPAQHTLTAIRHGCRIDQLGEAALSNAEACLRPQAKLRRLYPECWIQTTQDIADQCDFCLSELSYQYPSEFIPSGSTASHYLKHLVEEGAQKRYPEGVPDDIQALIDKELTLIKQQQYECFFLTIYDLVQFAKKNNILYQGRGSAANSVVCYCLEITAVSPDKIGMLFERFISKERNEPPDIDVDFEHQRREEVIQYIYQKYGRERTALAATVISYRRKSAIRDVGKALGIHEAKLDFFINNINHRDKEIPWTEQLSQLGLDPKSPKSNDFVSLVNTLIGFPRHLSQHVGGFVISASPLHELVPVENAAMAERTVIQWDKDDLETLKLLKVDVLALGMLTAIRRCFDLIKLHYGHHWSIADISNLGDDPGVYKMIQRADTIGVFQIESRAQMSMLPRLKPKSYYDLVIEIAIVRPGPIQGDMVHPYLLRRFGREPVDYPSEPVRGVLERTLGIPIFQEQVIQLAMVAAGFSGGEADQLRRAMASWKKNGKLNAFRDKLLSGMTERGYSEAYAERIFQQICGFGEYGFPESHSASFAILAYVSAWLKYYYPEVFFTALLNSWPMGFYPPSQLVQNARCHRVAFLPVCINRSQWEHQLEASPSGWSVRLGFRQIKGVPRALCETLCHKRPPQGFRHIHELKELLPMNVLQALASADALRSMSENRYACRWQLMDDTQTLPLFKNEESSTSGWGFQPNLMESMQEDYASQSLSLDHHPVALLHQAGKLPECTFSEQLPQLPHKALVTVIGLVTCRQRPGTAAGVTFITLEDHTGLTNVVLWKGTAQQQRHAYISANLLRVEGILERGDGGVTHVIAGRLEKLDHLLDDFTCHSRDFH